LKTYLWFIIPVSQAFLYLSLIYVSQGSIYFAVTFTTGGINAAVMTPPEKQMLFSSRSIQNGILQVLEVFGAQLAGRITFPYG